MMKDNKEINTSRRDLLKGLTTAAVAGAVVAGTTKVASASETVEPSEKDVKKKGYRETQHIRDYYDTLEITDETCQTLRQCEQRNQSAWRFSPCIHEKHLACCWWCGCRCKSFCTGHDEESTS
ncbi:LOW QUALITY PROTEIN: formate dehydrogenase subunit or accessory protein [Vibrio sp. JCM 19052]|nr:LOW QUALITY PROTEIN: formate dehydrogenase subunit or accessory protein [Vibrio sp. JCM 19052]